MAEYQSIRSDVLSKVEAHLPEIRERFGIEKLCLFGSVSREEDTPDSDIDLAYTRTPGRSCSLFMTVELIEFLETLLGRSVDLVPLNWVKPQLLRYIEQDSIECDSSGVPTGGV